MNETSRLVKKTLRAGFTGGWRAGLEYLAIVIERDLKSAHQKPDGMSIDVPDLLKLVRTMAANDPPVATVEMKPGETIEEAEHRAEVLEPTKAPGAFPNAEEALPTIASILHAIPEGDLPPRRKYAEWVALLGFALFARDCAALEGKVAELDREAGNLRDFLAGSEPFPPSAPLPPPATVN